MASLDPSNLRLFGADLSHWPHQWRAAWDALFASRALAAFTPDVRLRLQHADGRHSLWALRGPRASTLATAVAAEAGQGADAAPLRALELPSADVLERELQLPPLKPADLATAVHLQVQALSPFPAAKTVHGWRVHPRRPGHVSLAIASADDIDAHLQAHASDGPAPEIWVLPASPGAPDSATTLAPIVLPGAGDALRQRLQQRGRRLRLGLLALVAALGLALLITPTAQLRLRAIDAQHRYDALAAQTRDALAQREALTQQAEQIARLRPVTDQQLALLPVLDMLSQTLPDGAWLQSLRVEGAKLSLGGNADNATQLVQRLSQQPGVRSARLSAPATRSPRGGKESFSIELELDPARWGLIRADGPPAAAAPATAKPPAPPASVP